MNPETSSISLYTNGKSLLIIPSINAGINAAAKLRKTARTVLKTVGMKAGLVIIEYKER
ncbi:MAG TPA: hypothetical protein VIL05_09085 [Thermoclostridium sp.]